MHSFVGNNFLKNIQEDPFIAPNCTPYIINNIRSSTENSIKIINLDSNLNNEKIVINFYPSCIQIEIE